MQVSSALLAKSVSLVPKISLQGRLESNFLKDIQGSAGQRLALQGELFESIVRDIKQIEEESAQLLAKENPASLNLKSI